MWSGFCAASLHTSARELVSSSLTMPAARSAAVASASVLPIRSGIGTFAFGSPLGAGGGGSSRAAVGAAVGAVFGGAPVGEVPDVVALPATTQPNAATTDNPHTNFVMPPRYGSGRGDINQPPGGYSMKRYVVLCVGLFVWVGAPHV